MSRGLRAAAVGAVVVGLVAGGCQRGPATTQFLEARRAAGIADCPTTAPARPLDDGLPHLTLECLGGDREVNLWELRGRPTLVVFWAQWCQPCRAEMPVLGRLLPEYGDRLQTMMVATNETRYGDAIEFARDTGVLAPQLVDPDMTVLAATGLPKGIPQSVLLDADGRIVQRHSGGWDEATLRAALGEVGL